MDWRWHFLDEKDKVNFRHAFLNGDWQTIKRMVSENRLMPNKICGSCNFSEYAYPIIKAAIEAEKI